ncbi:MAG: GNAT family N-acetyltransferase [Stenotrophobium sp.]
MIAPPDADSRIHQPLRRHEKIAAIDAATWDALFNPDYPFTRHAFLRALEDHGCVTPRKGWQPCHATLEDAAGQIVAAAPLYLKQHSYGEFVFDWAWAEASQRLGAPYYPKLLCAVPFTPCQGSRLGALDDTAKRALAAALSVMPTTARLSSLHVLFAKAADRDALMNETALPRCDVQFHWHNHGYADFADFLSRLTADKRKKILRERRRIAESGLQFEVIAGDQLDESGWADVLRLYGHTYEERGQAPYLNLDFFLDYGARSGTSVRLILCRDGARLVAVAITILGGDTLYGRHWGAEANYHSLHFETCYYQGIDYCIRERLARYDAGAQGEHKLARGFEPCLTHSLHWLTEPRLADAVARHLQRERPLVEARCDELRQHMPYRRNP